LTRPRRSIVASVAGVAVVAFWIVFSTVPRRSSSRRFSPTARCGRPTHRRAQFSSFFQTAATTAGAAAVASTTGIPFVTAGRGRHGRVLSTLSTAAGTAAPGPSSSLALAAAALRSRSSRRRHHRRQAVRELIAKGKGNYY
jgi:hypothetical protein